MNLNTSRIHLEFNSCCSLSIKKNFVIVLRCKVHKIYISELFGRKTVFSY